MKRHYLLFAFGLCLLLVSGKSDRPAYRLFNEKGKPVTYNGLLKEAMTADIILFGEAHDNPICHWLELQLTKDLYKEKKTRLILGAEMFERDNQLLLNEYFSKMIRKKDFEAEAKLWKNYGTDYAPIVDYARENGIRFIATNIPRRFAAIVNLKGFDGLDSINAVERGMIAPLPIKYNPNLECYKDILEGMGDAANSHASQNIAKAQAIKDATMAHFILKNGSEGMTFLHFNGSYHSEKHQGIVWYLHEYIKKTAFSMKIITIATVEQGSLEELEDANKGKADFILCIPDDMTKTQVSSFESSAMKPMTAMPKPPAPLIKSDSVKLPADTTDTDSGDDDDD